MTERYYKSNIRSSVPRIDRSMRIALGSRCTSNPLSIPHPQPNADSLLLSTLLMQQPVVPHLHPSAKYCLFIFFCIWQNCPVWRCIIFLGWVLPFLGGCYFLSFSTIFLPGWKSLHLKSSLELCSPLKPLYGLVYCVRINSSRTITFHWDPHAGARKSTVTAQPSVTKTSSTLEHQIRSALEDD